MRHFFQNNIFVNPNAFPIHRCFNQLTYFLPSPKNKSLSPSPKLSPFPSPLTDPFPPALTDSLGPPPQTCSSGFANFNHRCLDLTTSLPFWEMPVTS